LIFSVLYFVAKTIMCHCVFCNLASCLNLLKMEIVESLNFF